MDPDRRALPPAPEAMRMPLHATPRSRRSLPRRAPLPALLLLPALALSMAGCSDRSRPLTPGELSDDETLYVTRVIVLERVKAALVTDPRRGAALGDSLATAWGDSALPRTLELAPTDPDRAERVHGLLLRLLAAEQDSLLRHDGLRPLDAAWPAPADSVPGARFPASARVSEGG